MKIVECFSQTYDEARQRFLAAADDVGATQRSVVHPLTGPDGEELALDIACVGPADAARVLVIGSGTHGVEGFCGSALQTALLNDGLATRLPPDVRVVFFHANNPYGFAHLRRVNEDNVDLNRNFLDHSQPYPTNPPYDTLSASIAPDDYSEAAQATATETMLAFQAEHGFDALQEAISAGQYNHPTGLFFGGNHEVWSNVTIRAALEEDCARATHVVLVDLHTGLGEYCDGEIIYNDPPESAVSRRVVSWWGDRAKNTLDGSSVSADLAGPMKLAFDEMCPQAETTAVALEFGTVPSMDVFFALQAENWAHHHSDPSDPRYGTYKKAIRDAFYPDNDEWKNRVWGHTQEVIAEALVGISAAS